MKKFLLLVAAVVALVMVFCVSISASDPNIEIASADDFAKIGSDASYPADGSYRLTQNFTLSATNATAFTGELDGNGKTVTVSAPMFAKFAGKIKNLTVDGAIGSAETAFTGAAGAIAAELSGTASFTDITNNATITATGISGGLVGTSTGNGYEVTFTNCINNASITGKNAYAAGIAGNLVCTSTFTNCKNTAKVAGGTSYSSGIVARAYANITFTGCENSGEVGGGNFAAGILTAMMTANAKVVFTDCKNSGRIYTAVTGNNDCGGIAGYITAGTSLEIVGCENSGIIEGARRSGGILGFSEINTTIKDCLNKGNIKTGRYSGGIVSTFYKSGISLTVENCYNEATVAGTDDAGGIVSHFNGKDFSATACANSAEITSGKIAGGIVGNNSSAVSVSIQKCYNTGALNAAGASVCGIIGNTKCSAVTIKACYSTGALNGTGAATVKCAVAFIADTITLADATGISGNFFPENYADCLYRQKPGTEAADLITVANENTVKAEDIASGKLCYLLNTAAGSNVYFQTIAAESYPTLDNKQDIVYYHDTTDTYSNSLSPETSDFIVLTLCVMLVAVIGIVATVIVRRKIRNY